MARSPWRKLVARLKLDQSKLKWVLLWIAVEVALHPIEIEATIASL